MKLLNLRIATAMFLFISLSTFAQSNRVISYQGILEDGTNRIPDGLYMLTVSLYDNPSGVNSIWTDNFMTQVRKGIFNIMLGSSKSLPESRILDTPLWIGVSINGDRELRPLTQLGAVPFAINISDKAITKEKLADDLLVTLSEKFGQVAQTAGVEWHTGGNNPTTGDFNDNDSLGSKAVGGSGKSGDWQMIHNGERVKKFQRTKPYIDIIEGYKDNAIEYTGSLSGVYGANTISGGGAPDSAWSGPNTIRNASFGTIGGGANNHIGDTIEDHHYWVQTIAGGGKNHAIATYTSIGGGDRNTAGAEGSTISGGYQNFIADTNTFAPIYSTISGGAYDSIYNGSYSVITGGKYNQIHRGYSAIAGGHHLKLGEYSFGFNAQPESDDAYLNLSSSGANMTNIAIFNDADVLIGNVGNVARNLRFYEPNSSHSYVGAKYSSIKADTQSADISYTLPPVIGAAKSILFTETQVGTVAKLRWLPGPTINGQVLIQKSGQLAWDTISGGGGLALKWYAESDSSPVLAPIATGEGAVSHGEAGKAFGDYSSVGGGHTNIDSADYAVIGGGYSNMIEDTASLAYIGGGYKNQTNPNYSVIVGGDSNIIKTNYAGFSGFTLKGGDFIGSGSHNEINFNGRNSFNVIVGGNLNKIDGLEANFIGGGEENTLEGSSSVLTGGYRNYMYTGESFIGCGSLDSVWGIANVIVGGVRNLIRADSASLEYAFIGGGYDNQITDTSHTFLYGWYSVIAGGLSNLITEGHSTIGGGSGNKVLAAYSTIAGGSGNLIDLNASNADFFERHALYSVIGGGYNNKISYPVGNDLKKVGVPYHTPQYVTISGGRDNGGSGDYSSIMGGDTNRAGAYGSVLGGISNVARDFQVVGGRFNKIRGETGQTTLGHADSVLTFPSGDMPLFILGNGTGNHDSLRSQAFEVSNSGHSTVFHENNEGITSMGDSSFSGEPNYLGTTYLNNILYAWGDIDTAGGILPNKVHINGSSGIKRARRLGTGIYEITLFFKDPITGNPINLTSGSVTANVIDPFEDSVGGCHLIYPSEILTDAFGNNVFKIRIRYLNTCEFADRRFTFKVTGRP